MLERKSGGSSRQLCARSSVGAAARLPGPSAAPCAHVAPTPPLCPQDIFDKIAVETGNLARYNKKPTITSREIQTAVRLILPGAHRVVGMLADGCRRLQLWLLMAPRLWTARCAVGQECCGDPGALLSSPVCHIC